MTKPTIYTFTPLLLFAFFGFAQASSQLAPIFDALAKDPRTVMDIDLPRLVPSEEIPVLARVLNGGNFDLMLRAVGTATEILQIHVNDDRPYFHLLQPPLPEVKQEFQKLVPILNIHFNDAEPPGGGYNGVTDDTEIAWKTRVVQFMNVLGSQPSPEMLTWMLKVLQWPNDSGRAEAGMVSVDARVREIEAHGGAKYSASGHDAMLATTRRNEQQVAFEVIPVLANLNPMLASVLSALLVKTDDTNETYAASLTIFHLSQNKSVNRPALADLLVTKALNTSLPVELRAAAIHGVGFLDVMAAKAKLKGLDRDPNDKIASAAIDAGIN